MSFKMTISKDLQRMLDNKSPELLKNIKKEFSKKSPVKVKQAIVQDMVKGISPVKGQGKFKQYSPSYKKAIRKGRLKTAKTKKAISPVNLKLSGEMRKSLKAYTSGGYFKNFRLIISYKHFLADIHNRRGAGRSKVIRRLLPTFKGEQFNRRISLVLKKQLQNAVDKTIIKFNN